jgi:hypothetical protein
MSKKILFPAASVLAAVSALAFAGPAPTEAPSMQFRVLPMTEKVPVSEHRITPYRINDLMHVVVRDPVRCGQRPVNPTFELKNGQLTLHYDLTAAEPGAGACTLATEFNVKNAPHQDLRIAFSGGQEASASASLQRCSFYHPTTDDVFECLTPAQTASAR